MEERGQYITMLCLQHLSGHLNEKTISLSVGSVSVDVLSKFKIDEDGLYYNERLQIEIEKRSKFTKSRTSNGLKGGRPKKEYPKDTSDLPTADSDWFEMVNFFNNKCICCGSDINGIPTKDHVVPRISGGSDDINNLQPLCRECNSSKSSDHTTDYRLNYTDLIPLKLAKKWFSNNLVVLDSFKKTKAKEKLPINRNRNIDLKEVEDYFFEKGYSKDAAKKFFDYYSVADWCDSKGIKLRTGNRRLNRFGLSLKMK